MSNKSRLQTNNTNLQALIDKANALPDAGSGSGGGSVQTATVTVNTDAHLLSYINADGEIEQGMGTIECLIPSFVLSPSAAFPLTVVSGAAVSHNTTAVLVTGDCNIHMGMNMDS